MRKRKGSSVGGGGMKAGSKYRVYTVAVNTRLGLILWG